MLSGYLVGDELAGFLAELNPSTVPCWHILLAWFGSLRNSTIKSS